MSLIDQAPRMASARARTDSVLWAISQEHFNRILNASPSTAQAILRVALSRWRATSAALQQSEENLRGVVETLEDPYFEVDLAGNLTYANDPFCETLGYSRQEIIGSNFRRLAASRAHVRELFLVLNAVYRTGEPRRGVEYTVRRKDGAVRHAESSMSLMRDADGRPIGFRGIAHDVTDRKQFQEELRRAKEAAERELEIGREIQAGFLPNRLPQPSGWEIASHFRPAREVAGDFYDAFELARGKRVGLIVADVCGKGVGAALFMALFRSLIRAFAEQNFSTSALDLIADGPTDSQPEAQAIGALAIRDAVRRIVTDTNNYIARVHYRANTFATVFFGVLDPATGCLTYVNGGHEPPAIVSASGVTAHLSPTGPAVGLMAGMEFRAQEICLAPDDMLIAHTDGVTDARDASGAFFGEAQLLSLLAQPDASAAGLIDRIATRVHAHVGAADQYDDITLLAVRRVADSALPAHSIFEISQPALIGNLSVMRQFVEDACRRAGVDEDTSFALQLAADEACTNIATHGYAGLAPGPIHLALQFRDGQAAVTITDFGHAFDPAQAPIPDVRADWADRPIGGLGIHIMRHAVDEIQYRTDPDTGNHLTLIKRLNSKDTPRSSDMAGSAL
jgi:sigma-B regulation protein RsbU (phosphoserine phosphatase)